MKKAEMLARRVGNLAREIAVWDERLQEIDEDDEQAYVNRVYARQQKNERKQEILNLLEQM